MNKTVACRTEQGEIKHRRIANSLFERVLVVDIQQ